MKRSLVALFAVLLAHGLTAPASAQEALQNAVVHFGQPLPPAGTPPAVTHFLLPDDVTIQKGGTVTFVVNGGGHGIAIHEVDKKTTRDDIAADLCQGVGNTADRLLRSAVCNGTIATGAGSPLIVGTQNLNYDITDAKDVLIIRSGENNPASGDPTKVNPRVDDTEHTHRLLATSGRVITSAAGVPSGDNTAPAANAAGAFLLGSAAPVSPATVPTVGQRIQVQFPKTGRFLVVCMNRGHYLNDHMFGFVSVVSDDDDR